MLTTEQNERFTRVGPNTPCGELMRRYWHPIAASSQLLKPGTKPITILGESLVLYRDRQGRLGLLEPPCAHRKAGLIFGMPHEDGLRCTYHGWLYNAEGWCIEQPFETFVDPGSTFKGKVQIKAYPVEELGGLIFAYLGPEPRPLLPRWEGFVLENAYREIGMALIPCNWLQTVENAGDGSHVVTTHWEHSHYVLERLGRSDLRRHAGSSGAEGYRIAGHRDRNWAGIGAVIFPYMDPHGDLSYQIRVPVDDTHTLHIWYMAYPADAQQELGIEMPPQADPREAPVFDVPVPLIGADGEPDWALLDNNSGQDLVMWYSQGPIMDRTTESLGHGDEQIIAYRKLLEEQITVVEDGGDPINTFRDPAENEYLVPPQFGSMRPRIAPDGRPDLTNAVRKYAGAFRQASINRLGPEYLNDPVH